ncbi:FkbM family methyltransferase [Peijinzhouia sedimentorum]
MAKHPFKKKIHLFISNRRSSPIFKSLFNLAKKYISIYENRNNDHNTNGELRVIKILSKHNPKIVFDVGANVGDWSILASNKFPNASIHSFEPIPATFQKLNARVSPNKYVHLNNFGLSDKTQSLEFNYFPDRSTFTSIYDIKLENTLVQKVLCRLRNSKEYCLEANIQEIDFLKIDTEGSDYLVLKGLEEYLQQHKIRVIQFEYNLNNILSKFLLRDFYELLNKYGYQIGKIYPKSVEFKPYNIEMEDFIGLNYLAVHKSDKGLIEELR